MSNDFKVTNVRVSIDVSRAFDRVGVHKAMATRYKQIVQGSFGPDGQNRATPWPALNPAYAKRVNPKVPTLMREKKRIYNSIFATADSNAGHVFCTSDLGPYHQYGMGKNKLRPFFPFYRNGQPTAYAQAEMERVAKEFLGK